MRLAGGYALRGGPWEVRSWALAGPCLLLRAAGPEEVFEATIAAPFAGGSPKRPAAFDPAAAPEALGALLRLARDHVDGVEVADSGDLVVTFQSGDVLHVPPDDHREAWNLSVAEDELIVCPPGGDDVWRHAAVDLARARRGPGHAD